jgi:hypothetical protein
MEVVMSSHNIVTSLIVVATIAIGGCNDLGSGYRIPPDTSNQVTITQGIWGNVWFWEGDFMPGSVSGTITPVQREVLVYEATRYDSVVFAGGGFYRAIFTKLVAVTRSNATGFYEVSLPPGKYSLFVVEDSLYYANPSDNMGHIQPGTVAANQVTKVQIDIDYRAAY